MEVFKIFYTLSKRIDITNPATFLPRYEYFNRIFTYYLPPIQLSIQKMQQSGSAAKITTKTNYDLQTLCFFL